MFIIAIFLSQSMCLFAQKCDCESNFEWVKKTFEENDAGFDLVILEKGDDLYKKHVRNILKKVKSAKSMSTCGLILYEYLTFFREGHIAISLTPEVFQSQNSTGTVERNTEEKIVLEENEFRKYLDAKENIGFEGIWQLDGYKIGIKNVNGEYKGIILASQNQTWTKDEIKLCIVENNQKTNSIYYMGDHSKKIVKRVDLIGTNYLQLDDFLLKRVYPEQENDPQAEQYIKSFESDQPYLERLNETTLYLRIPSFQASEKQAIDSVLEANETLILSTENLILDIRNGTGGSDISFNGLLPYLYTNQIRSVGIEFLSTELNNQRMLDFVEKEEFGFSEDEKKWAKMAYEKLNKNQGSFVNLEENSVSIVQMDTVYPFPKKVGIIINERNGSTDEEFLMAAKQSQKVKLFGTSTYGILDVSNMYFVLSPSGEFELGYCLSRSLRIPDFTIDGHGIQPDFYLDPSIPHLEWTNYVNELLNMK